MISRSAHSWQNRLSSVALRRIVGAIGLIAALAVSLAGPVSFAIAAYLELAEVLAFKAQLNASKISKFVYAHEKLWQYQHVRLTEIIELPHTDPDEPIRQRVTDTAGRVVLEEGPPLAGPLLRRQAPIVVRGNVVGAIELESSLTPFLGSLALIGLVSLAVGVGAYIAFRVLPLRLLDRTLGRLEVQNQRFDLAVNNMSEGLCLFDADRRLVVSNERYARMYGMQPADIKPGMLLEEILEKRVSTGLYAGPDPKSYARDLFALTTAGIPGSAIREMNDGRMIVVKYQPVPGKGWVSTHEDVTEQRRVQERIAHMAHHDGLTNLVNRVLLRERLGAALADVDSGKSLAVLCLDLDRFKEINDALGHACGDALLKGIAERLRSCVRDTDTVARIGGDEFAVIQIGGEQPRDAETLATRLIGLLSAPVDALGHQLTVSTSVGIAIAPSDGTEVDQLLRNADLALYRAKSDGRSTYRFFEPEMDRQMQARRKVENDLRKALHNGEFELHYQPIANLERDAICGVEALLRWNHAERGRISPVEFIPLAEETGLIVPIGEWVLRQACRDAAGWPDHLRVAVNVSAAQFKSPNLAAAVINALAASGLVPQRLELEITESVMVEEADAAYATLTQLHDLGVHIAFDDFGTGYSSLSNLRKLPFDKIKIDRSFIADLSETNTDAVAVVRAIASLGISLGKATTAEGVETREQLEMVRAEGCTEAQGYFVGKPRRAAEITRLLARSFTWAVEAA